MNFQAQTCASVVFCVVESLSVVLQTAEADEMA